MQKFIIFFKNNIHNKITFYVTLFFSMILKFSPFGFKYFTYLDDNNQYGVFSLIKDDVWNDIIVANKLYSFRPLAALLDVYIIAPLFNNLYVVLFFMIFLHLASIYLLNKIFEDSQVMFGKVSSVCFGLYPLLAEASYWISASSRLVAGLFFCLLSIYLLLWSAKLDSKHQKLMLILGLLFGIISQGFYEQIIIFSLFFTALVFILNHKKIKTKLYYSIPIINFTISGIYYYVFRNVGNLSQRGQTGNLFSRIPEVLRNIFNVFYYEQKPTLIYTFREGMFKIWSSYRLLFILILIISLLLALTIYFEKIVIQFEKTGKNTLISFFTATLIFIVPFAPFFILESSFIYLRNIYISVISIGIVLQILWNLFQKNKILKILISICAFFICFYSISCNVIEVDGFRIIEKYNKKIATAVVSEVSNINKPHKQVFVFDVKYTYEDTHIDHLASSTLYDWAFTGQVEVIEGKIHDASEGFYINPILPNSSYSYNLSSDEIILLALDEDFLVREIYFSGNKIKFKDTDEMLGTISFSEEDPNQWIFFKQV